MTSGLRNQRSHGERRRPTTELARSVTGHCGNLMGWMAAKPIVVNSFLDLRSSDMTMLPQLYVRDSMNIEHSQIAELAPGTRIVGSLYAAGSKLTHLPEDLTVGCNPDDPTNGSLMIEGLPITELPESLTVGGLIRAAGSHLTWDGIPRPLWPQVRGLGPPGRDGRPTSP